MEVDEHEGVAELLVEVELVVVEEEVERERGIYMFRGYRYALRDQHTT